MLLGSNFPFLSLGLKQYASEPNTFNFSRFGLQLFQILTGVTPGKVDIGNLFSRYTAVVTASPQNFFSIVVSNVS